MSTKFFDGVVKMYLQGHNAAYVTHVVCFSEVKFFLSRPQSRIIIHDYRQASVKKVIEIVTGLAKIEDEPQFCDLFNLPGHVIGFVNGNEIEFFIYDPESGLSLEKLNTLWLAGLTENSVPAYDTIWENYAWIENKKNNDVLAVASLIRYDPAEETIEQ